MQIKTQIEVELHEADVKEAIQDYLGKNGIAVTAEDIDSLKVTNPRNEGVRVNLTVKSEKVTEEVKAAEVAEPTPVAEEEPKTAELDPDTAEYVDDEPGVIAANTVEDVMPSVDEIAAMQATETEAVTTPAARPAFGHFGRKD